MRLKVGRFGLRPNLSMMKYLATEAFVRVQAVRPWKDQEFEQEHEPSSDEIEENQSQMPYL